MLLSNYMCASFDRCKISGRGIGCSGAELAQNDDLDQSSFNVNLHDSEIYKGEDGNDSFDDIKIEAEIPSER